MLIDVALQPAALFAPLFDVTDKAPARSLRNDLRQILSTHCVITGTEEELISLEKAVADRRGQRLPAIPVALGQAVEEQLSAAGRTVAEPPRVARRS